MDAQIEKVLGTIKDFERLQSFEANIVARNAMTPEVEAALKTRGGLIARDVVSQQTGLDLIDLSPAEELVVRAVSEYLGMKRRQGRGAA
ncbi:MAG: hypothetical protein P4M09_20690 [Devosia sp.]|nr:hypothetical protein [Devosia sp.]